MSLGWSRAVGGDRRVAAVAASMLAASISALVLINPAGGDVGIAAAAAASTNGRIAFPGAGRSRTGKLGVGTIKPDGAGPDPGDRHFAPAAPGCGRAPTNPSWSPDGSQDRLQHRGLNSPLRCSRASTLFTIAPDGSEPHGTAAWRSTTGTETRRIRPTARRSPSTRTSVRAQPNRSTGFSSPTADGSERPAPDHQLRHQGGIRHQVAVVDRRHDDRVHQGQERAQGGDLHDPHRRHRADPADPVQARRRESRLVARRDRLSPSTATGTRPAARRHGSLHDAGHVAATWTAITSNEPDGRPSSPSGRRGRRTARGSSSRVPTPRG